LKNKYKFIFETSRRRTKGKAERVEKESKAMVRDRGTEKERNKSG
jgi:hypothetical protein